jgi:hypothetical protein
VTTAQPAGGDLDLPGSELPDSVAFDHAAGFYDETRRLAAEAEASHPDLDTPQPARHTFGLVAFRF